jgi:hypothetical protein
MTKILATMSHDFRILCTEAISGTPDELMEVLVYPGFKIDQKNANGFTMLHSVAMNHNTKNVLVCLSVGADVNAVDLHGNTPLHVAIDAMKDGEYLVEFEAVVQLLIFYKANIHARNDQMQTPLHVAARVGEPNVLRFLMDQGAFADIGSSDNHDHLPLYICRENYKTWIPNRMLPKMCIELQHRRHIDACELLFQASQNEASGIKPDTKLPKCPRMIFQHLVDEDVLCPIDDFLKDIIEGQEAQRGKAYRFP